MTAPTTATQERAEYAAAAIRQHDSEDDPRHQCRDRREHAVIDAARAGVDVELREAAATLITTWDVVALRAIREGWPAMPQDFGYVADAVKVVRAALGKDDPVALEKDR